VRVIETTSLRIGDLAAKTQKTVRTLRYYEELGLLEPSSHTGGGFRLYRAEDVNRVLLIDRLQDLGFRLEKIGEILQAWGSAGTGGDASGRLQTLLQAGLADTRTRIGRLQGMERELEEALHFLVTCRSCVDQPGRQHCTTCEKGDHHGRLPQLVDAVVR